MSDAWHFTRSPSLQREIGRSSGALTGTPSRPKPGCSANGPKAALGRDRVKLSAVNWIGGDGPAEARDGEAVSVKIRSAMEPVPATLHRSDDGTAEVVFHAPQFGVSPGQACVFYAGDRVLGGGWIEREAGSLAA